MNAVLPRREELVEEVLAEFGLMVDRRRKAAWSVLLSGLSADVMISEDWLLLSARLGSFAELCRQQPAEQWLRLNGSLPGPIKFTLTPADLQLQLQADLPLDDERDDGSDIAGDLRAACRDLRAAWEAAAQQDSQTLAVKPPPVRPGDVARSEDARELKACLSQCAWEVVDRKNGRFAVRLETGTSDFRQAICGLQPNGEVHIAIEVVELPAGTTPDGVAATAQLLMISGSVVRLVRGVFATREESTGWSGQLEVRFHRLPPPWRLAQALEALSVAYRLCGQEARVLSRSPAMAACYLEQFHPLQTQNSEPKGPNVWLPHSNL